MTSNAREVKDAVNWVLGLMKAGEEKGVHATLEEVTPAKARALLDQNPDNRSIKPSKVDQYSRDMSEGRYEGLNGETIILAKTGQLNDGQNRLEAIVKTGLVQRLLIAVGVSRESRKTVDIGANRNAGDYLRMSGDPYGNTTAAAARRITAYQATGSFATGRVSTPEAIKMGEEDPHLKAVAAWAAGLAKGMRAFRLSASELATLRYLFDKKATKGQPIQFFHALGSGANLKEDSPVLALRNKLTRNADRLNVAQRAELVIKAWNYWIRDESNTDYQVNNKLPDIRGPKNGRA